MYYVIFGLIIGFQFCFFHKFTTHDLAIKANDNKLGQIWPFD